MYVYGCNAIPIWSGNGNNYEYNCNINNWGQLRKDCGTSSWQLNERKGENTYTHIYVYVIYTHTFIYIYLYTYVSIYFMFGDNRKV